MQGTTAEPFLLQIQLLTFKHQGKKRWGAESPGGTTADLRNEPSVRPAPETDVPVARSRADAPFRWIREAGFSERPSGAEARVLRSRNRGKDIPDRGVPTRDGRAA